MGALHCAERVVLLDSFDPATVLSAIVEHSVTHLHMVPRLMVRLADLPAETRASYDLNTLRFALHGAAACPRSVKEALIAWWGPIFREYYATSEFGIVSQIDSDEWCERPTSVGRPFEGVDVEIRDLISDERLPPQQLGRIYMRSDDMPDFHYREADTTTTAKTRGDWVTVHDVGYLDDDGFLHLTGRADDIANISGVKLNSQATRAALLMLPYIDDALVQVVADRQRGDALRSAVRLKTAIVDVTTERIRRDLGPLLPRLAIPREIAIVNELPVMDSGKTITRYLDLENAFVDTDETIVMTGMAGRVPPAPHFPAGIDVIPKGVTASTNDDALALASSNRAPLTLVWAEQQSAGRGRGGRRWVSEAGNVYWTMLVNTADERQNSTSLVFVTALAVLSTIRAVTPGNLLVETKWPNDTLIDGRKVSGVLIEATRGPDGPMHAIGVGINVASFPSIGMMYPATCLRAEGSAAHRNDILTLLTSSFLGYLELWRSSGFGPLRDEYLRSAHRFRQTISVQIGPNERVTGRYEDVTEAGIVLTLANGALRTIGAGDLLRGSS